MVGDVEGPAGHALDAETGFVYLRARYYDPVTAQFLTRDPLVAETGSAYGYVDGNPLNGSDPSGLKFCFHNPFGHDDCQSLWKQHPGTHGPLIVAAAAGLATAAVACVLTTVGICAGVGVGAGASAPALSKAADLGGDESAACPLKAAAAEGRALESAFHHTTTQVVDAISRDGLVEGSYATPTGGLGPLQAHIELALNPAGGARNAILEIDLAGLRSAGYDIPDISRVTGAKGMAGGGYEMQFLYSIPPEFIKVIQS